MRFEHFLCALKRLRIFLPIIDLVRLYEIQMLLLVIRLLSSTEFALSHERAGGAPYNGFRIRLVADLERAD
jgi:hypothetical protein